MNKEDDLSRHQNNSSQINDTKNDLRTGAEALITKEEKRSFENLEELSLKEIISIVHELRVHQIELEMQNDELKRIQLELDHARARYFDIYDLAPEGYLIVSEKGLILESNLTAANMLWVTRTNLIKQRFSQYIYKEDQVKYYIHRKKLFETLIPEECELRITRNDGTTLWVHMKATVVTEEGLPVCRLVMSDISTRKEAELALKESQSIMLAAFENSQAGIAIADAPDGKLRYVNKAGLLIRDKSEEEIVKGIDAHNYVAAWKMLHFDGKPLAEDEVPLTRAILYGEACSDEFIIRRDSLEDRYVLANAAPIKDSNNNIIAGIVVFLDITERKQIEVQLKQNIDDLLESQRIAHLGTWRLNLVTNHVVWSEELYKMYGFDPTIPPPPYTEHMKLFTPESWDILSTSLERTSTSGIPYELELETVKSDGSKGWMWVRGEANKDSRGNIVSLRGAAQDITEKKKQEAEKKSMEAHISQQQRLESIGILAGGVAHEINNPLNGIMNYGQLILDSLDADTKNAEFAKEIVSESNRIAVIVKNLLQFSRNEKQQYSTATIKDIVESTLSLINTVMKHDQIDLQIDIPEDLPQLKCRSQQIQQVIMNLMTNARDTLNEKYPGYHEDKIIKLNCKQFNKEDRKWIRITVEDHGNGIPEAIKGKIFEPFYSSKSRDAGTGLGLSISHGLIKDHHGELSFETEEGKYTRFHIDLPIDNGWKLG